MSANNNCCKCAQNPDRSVEFVRWFDPVSQLGYCDDHKPVHLGGLSRVAFLDGEAQLFLASSASTTIKQHTGSKYLRTTIPPEGCEPGQVDVYSVIEAFGVTCPATQHAVKKILCAGLRGKGDRVKDLTEAIDALRRAVEMERARK